VRSLDDNGGRLGFLVVNVNVRSFDVNSDGLGLFVVDFDGLGGLVVLSRG
jgi:hypothetical protein